jgi:hypothetical protein
MERKKEEHPAKIVPEEFPTCWFPTKIKSNPSKYTNQDAFVVTISKNNKVLPGLPKYFRYGPTKEFKDENEAYIAAKKYIRVLYQQYDLYHHQYRFIDENTIEVKTRVDGITFTADFEDLKYILERKWTVQHNRDGNKYLRGTFYDQEDKSSKRIYFHQLVSGFRVVDHIGTYFILANSD